MALVLDPPQAIVPAGGGVTVHNVVNATDGRLAIKVKSTNNDHYRVKPVYEFIQPGGSVQLEITRIAGPPKDDKFIIQYLANADAADAKAAFTGASPQGDVSLPISASAAQAAAPVEVPADAEAPAE